MESSVPTLLRPKNCSAAGKPTKFGPLPSHFTQPALTTLPPSGREREGANGRPTAGFLVAAKGGLKGSIQEVVCSESSPPPSGAHAVCTSVPKLGGPLGKPSVATEADPTLTVVASCAVEAKKCCCSQEFILLLLLGCVKCYAVCKFVNCIETLLKPRPSR